MYHFPGLRFTVLFVAILLRANSADYHIWILGGASLAFIREEGQLYEGVPIWRIEQISPRSPTAPRSAFSLLPWAEPTDKLRLPSSLLVSIKSNCAEALAFTSP